MFKTKVNQSSHQVGTDRSKFTTKRKANLNWNADREVTGEFLTRVMECLDTPISLSVEILARNGEWAQLVDRKVNPMHYNDAWRFAKDYQAISLVSKFPNFIHKDLNPSEKALAGFQESEAACADSNRRLKAYAISSFDYPDEVQIAFDLARQRIANVLGPLDLDRVSDLFRWGPGSTSSTRGKHTSPYNKFMASLDVTPNALLMGQCCVSSTPSWYRAVLQQHDAGELWMLASAFSVVPGNEVITVPKNAKTDRLIAIEPHVNSYLQAGFGRLIRQKLKRYGCDLDLGQSENSDLARRGSLDGSHATIDLKAASDRIAFELVRVLLPHDWVVALASLRCSLGTMPDGSVVRYEKFSSMGNGFTFELESLIFWALADASVLVMGGYSDSDEVKVYGDDVILPTRCAALFGELCKLSGFTFNEDKSFIDGPFRESCGKDFYSGVLVRPFFLKEKLQSIFSLFRAHNGLKRSPLCEELEPVVNWLRELVPRDLRYPIPEGIGDVGLVSNKWRSYSKPLSESSWEGCRVRTLSLVPKKHEMTDSFATLCYALYTRPGGDIPGFKGSGALRAQAREYSESLRDLPPSLGFYTPRDSTIPKQLWTIVTDR